ncbi:MAG: hypothetical protein VKJ04_09780 [Vampirovibrionales bacterium]|nr:hypothetical protein [Vampirovibrionales bacterium]
MNGATAFGIGVGAGGAGLYTLEQRLNSGPGKSGGGHPSASSPDIMTSVDTLDLGTSKASGSEVMFSGNPQTPDHQCQGQSCCAPK